MQLTDKRKIYFESYLGKIKIYILLEVIYKNRVHLFHITNHMQLKDRKSEFYLLIITWKNKDI